MRRNKYPLRRYPKYRTIMHASGASVGISELKTNPIKYIYAAEARPIKILRYGHIAALIITPEYHDEIAAELSKARTEAASLRNLLGYVSRDLLTYWESHHPDLTGAEKKYSHSSTLYLPELAQKYLLGIDEILDDLVNESDHPAFEFDQGFLDALKRATAQSKGKAQNENG